MMNTWDVVISGFLHDIGKFWQRADPQKSRTFHGELSSDFIDFIPLPRETNKDVIKMLVKHHHQSTAIKFNVQGLPSALQGFGQLVSHADRLSASLDREVDEDSKGLEPLLNPLKDITLPRESIWQEEDSRETSHDSFLPQETNWEWGSFFPVKVRPSPDQIQQGYATTWNRFLESCQRFKEIEESTSWSLPAWLETMDFMLLRYTTLIPSATYLTRPDISLYDHLRSTAAIVHCVATRQEHLQMAPSDSAAREIPQFYLIMGDFSGIQNYLLRVKNIADTRKGLLRRFKGRSLAISLALDAVATFTRIQLELPIVNSLVQTAGNFILLAPIIADDSEFKDRLDEKLGKIQNVVEKAMLKRFGQHLYCAIAGKPATINHLEKFGRLIPEVLSIVDQKKQQRYLSSIITKKTEFFVGEMVVSRCRSCERDVVSESDENDKICSTCQSEERLAKLIQHADYLIRIVDTNVTSPSKRFSIDRALLGAPAFEMPDLGVYYYAFSRKHASSRDIRTVSEMISFLDLLFQNDRDDQLIVSVQVINDPGLVEETWKLLKERGKTELISKIGWSLKLIGKELPVVTIPKKEARPDGVNEERPLTFGMLGELSRGYKRLSVLKADVDNLGTIFSQGLRQENTDRRSVSRLVMVSRLLDWFFKGVLQLLMKERYRIYQDVNLCDQCKKKAIRSKEIEWEFEDLLEDSEIPKPIFYFFDHQESPPCDQCRDRGTIPFYVGYAGGDDLLIIGPHDLLLQYVHDLRMEFHKYTGCNLQITFSAGMDLMHPHEPIVHGVHRAEEALERAKSQLVDASGLPVKNSICVFNEVLPWNEFHPDFLRTKGWKSRPSFSDVFADARWLEQLIYEKKLSKSMLYQWLRLWNQHHRRHELTDQLEEHRDQFGYYPYIFYQLGRNVKKEELRDALKERILRNFPWIRFIVGWCSFVLRT